MPEFSSQCTGGGFQVQGRPEASSGKQAAAAAVCERSNGTGMGERADQAHQGPQALRHEQDHGQEQGAKLQLQCLS